MVFANPLFNQPIKFNATSFSSGGDLTYWTRPEILNTLDGRKGLLSIWVRCDNGTANLRVWLGAAGLGVGLGGTPLGSNLVTISGINPEGTVFALRGQSTVPLTVDGSAWNHVLASWDNTLGLFRIYIDDVDRTDVIDQVDEDIAYFSGVAGDKAWNVGGAGDLAPSLFHSGCMSELYLHCSAFLDLTVEANRRKFITADKKPVYLGVDGSRPTTTQPNLLLRHPAGQFGVNTGKGGNFTLGSGTPAVCSTTP